MDNILVVMKYWGSINFPDDPDRALIEAPALLLPLLKTGQFELLTAAPWYAWEQTHHADYDDDVFDKRCILEVKMGLQSHELAEPDAIIRHIIAGVEQGKYLVERIDENQGPDVLQSIVTLSEASKTRPYLVEFKVPRQLESLGANAPDADIIKEILMLLQGGDVEIVDYNPTHEEEFDNHCDDSEVSENHTIFEIRLKLNEFNVDMNDPESVYYRVIDLLSLCDASITYNYNCGDAPLQKTVIGIDVRCTNKMARMDDYDDLKQQI